MDYYQVCGISFVLNGQRSPAREAIEEMFRFSSVKAASDPVTISVRQLEDPKGIAAALPPWLITEINDAPESDDVHLIHGPEGDRAALAIGREAIYCAWMSAGADHIQYTALKKTSALAPLSVSSVMVPILRDLLAARGAILMHAAAIGTSRGRGVLISADSGGGKTTTALSLLRSGAKLLADDLTVIRQDAEEIGVCGIPEALNLTDQTIAFFPEIERAVGGRGRRSVIGKHIVAAQTIYGPDCFGAPCPLKVIYFVSVSGQGPRVRVMPITELLGRLVHAHTFARGQALSESSVAQLTDILTRVPAYLLETGPDPVAVGPWILEHLDRHSNREI